MGIAYWDTIFSICRHAPTKERAQQEFKKQYNERLFSNKRKLTARSRKRVRVALEEDCGPPPIALITVLFRKNFNLFEKSVVIKLYRL